jgi:hypothetical protein
MLNSGGTVDRVIATRPTGFYTTAAEAKADPNGYAVAVNDTGIEEIVYPVYDIVIGRTGTGGTTISLEQLTDRRTKLAQGAGGGGASGGAGTDDKVRNSVNDVVNSYLIDKVVAGSGITLTTLNSGGNEQLQVNADVPQQEQTLAVVTNNIELDFNNKKQLVGINLLAVTANATISRVNTTNAQRDNFWLNITNTATITFPAGTYMQKFGVFTPAENGIYEFVETKVGTDYYLKISDVNIGS